MAPTGLFHLPQKVELIFTTKSGNMEPQTGTGLTWGIVGPGKIAREFVQDMKRVKSCLNIPGAVMSPRREEAAAFAREHHIAYWCDNIPSMFEHADLDIVYIASPHVFHYEQTLQCLKQHIPVLCEKPLALTADQAAEMIQVSHAYHTFLMEGMWIRFLPSLLKTLEWVDAGKIGDIRSLTANMSYVAPKQVHNRFYNPSLGGGSLLDLGIYPVYIAQLLLGPPLAIKATAALTPLQIDEGCAMILEHSAAYSVLESSLVKPTDKQVCIYGASGMITILAPWNEKSPGIRYDRYGGGTTYHPCHWPGRGFQYEIEEVIHCLGSGQIESDRHSHADSLRLMKLLDGIRAQTHICYPV